MEYVSYSKRGSVFENIATLLLLCFASLYKIFWIWPPISRWDLDGDYLVFTAKETPFFVPAQKGLRIKYPQGEGGAPLLEFIEIDPRSLDSWSPIWLLYAQRKYCLCSAVQFCALSCKIYSRTYGKRSQPVFLFKRGSLSISPSQKLFTFIWSKWYNGQSGICFFVIAVACKIQLRLFICLQFSPFLPAVPKRLSFLRVVSPRFGLAPSNKIQLNSISVFHWKLSSEWL